MNKHFGLMIALLYLVTATAAATPPPDALAQTAEELGAAGGPPDETTSSAEASVSSVSVQSCDSTATFDFEGLTATGASVGGYRSLSLTACGITMDLSRPGSRFDIFDSSIWPSVPDSWGDRSLANFYDINALGTPLVANFSQSIVGVAIEGGDFGPSDLDTLRLEAYSGLNATGSLLGADSVSYNESGFPSIVSASVNAAGIQSVKIFGGSTTFLNSFFFDNLRLTLAASNNPPVADAGGPYSVNEGGSASLSGSATDLDAGDTLSYAWDLDNNGSFETSGQNATFSAASLDGPDSRTVGFQVCDNHSDCDTDTATVTVNNVAPSASFGAPSDDVIKGSSFSLSLTSPSDPSSADTTAGFTYAFDCGDGAGYGAFGSSSTASCGSATVGQRTVGGKIRDKDGGIREYTDEVRVVYAFQGFFAPVNNPPTINTVKAGSGIPVKFSLGGDQGLNIFASGYPKSVAVSGCSGTATNAVEETVTAGGSSLTYDADDDQYVYVWKTEKNWSGCRQLVVKLIDGTEHRADFNFIK